MGRFLVEEQQYWSGNATVPKSSSFLEPGQISHTTMIFNVIVMGNAAIGILTSFTLLCGLYKVCAAIFMNTLEFPGQWFARRSDAPPLPRFITPLAFKDRRVLLLPWMLSVVITIVIDLSHSVYLFVLETMNFQPLTAILFTTDFFLLSLKIYCLLCVVSQYQEYKAGRGTADFEYINRRVPGVRYVPQPTGTSFLSTRRAVTYQETKASPTCSPPGLTEKAPHRKHVQFGELSPSPPYSEVVKQKLAPPQPQPSSIIHIESPKDSVSSEFNVRSGGSPSDEGGSSVEWPAVTDKPPVDTQPLIPTTLDQGLPSSGIANNQDISDNTLLYDSKESADYTLTTISWQQDEI